MSAESFPVPPSSPESDIETVPVPDFEDKAETVTRRIAPDDPERAAPRAVTTAPVHATVNPESPWLGLRSFTEHTRDYFFGRTAELQDLFERIEHKPLTVLFGQSGLGKTSLLQAALIPRLREQGYLPVLLRLDHTDGAPTLERQMLSAFRNAIYQAARGIIREVTGGVPAHRLEDPSALPQALAKSGYEHLRFPQDVESLWLLLHDPVFGFVKAPAEVSPVRPVFLFDQFEEIFTLGDRPERRDASLALRDALACLVENRPPAALRARLEHDDELADRLDYSARPAKVLLTLREDFLHVLERWRRLMPSLMDNRLELRLLTGPQALQAVVEPGKLRGADQPPIVSEATGAAIVHFVAGVKDDVPLEEIDAVPPLLSLICAELNARRFDSDGIVREATIRSEQLIGQSADILENFYRASFEGVPTAVRDLVEDRLLSADGFRENLALDTAHRILENERMAPGDARAAITKLVDRRLLVVEERGSVRRVELTHDVLTNVVRASRDKRDEIIAAEHAKREKIAAEAKASAQRRLVRRARLVGAGLAVLTLLSISALLWALAQRREAVAESEKARREELKAKTAESQATEAKEKSIDALKVAEDSKVKAVTSAQEASRALQALEQEKSEREKALQQSQSDTVRATDAEARMHRLLISTFPFRFAAALASNDEMNALNLFTDPTDYEGYGMIHKKLLSHDLRQTIKRYPFRNYTILGEPTILETDKGIWSIDFIMQYTLLNPQRQPATGKLKVTLTLDDQLRIIRDRNVVLEGHKPS